MNDLIGISSLYGVEFPTFPVVFFMEYLDHILSIPYVITSVLHISILEFWNETRYAPLITLNLCAKLRQYVNKTKRRSSSCFALSGNDDKITISRWENAVFVL